MVMVQYPSGVTGPMPPLPVMQFTVDEYHQMIKTGIIPEGNDYELLDGWVVRKMPKGSDHEGTADFVEDALRSALPAGWRLRNQRPITLSRSEPEPDYPVVVERADRYFYGHPTPADIGLVVEVSSSSLTHDRTTKGGIVARDSLPVYWIVNVEARVVEVYTDPSGPTSDPKYATRADYAPGTDIPLVLHGQVVATIPVSDFFV